MDRIRNRIAYSGGGYVSHVDNEIVAYSESDGLVGSDLGVLRRQ